MGACERSQHPSSWPRICEAAEFLECSSALEHEPKLDEFDAHCEMVEHPPLDGPKPTAEDSTLAGTDHGAALLWLRTKHFADGYASGPIALVELDDQTRVLAVGSLLAPSDGPRLRLMGNWLVVHAERCWPERGCQPTAQLLELDGSAFIHYAFDLDGRCTAPAELPLLLWARTKVRDGTREYELEREFHFPEDGMPIIHERLSVRRFDRSNPDSPVLEREVSLDRPLERDGRSLRAPPSLWAEVESEDLVEFEFPSPAEVLRGRR